MRSLININSEKQPFPAGSITSRWVMSRNKYQLYLGGKYLAGCSGDTESEACDEFEAVYECSPNWRESVKETHM